MSADSTLKSLVPLAVGLVVGVAGATMFRASLTGEKGSAEERVAKLEVELKKANNKIAALDDAPRRDGRTVKDGLRDIVADLRAGRPVTPDDILKLTKPLMRDLEPLMARMRVREEKRRIDSMTGELARKYNLTSSQQEALHKWFEQKSEADAKAWSQIVSSDSTTFEDMIRSTHDVRPDEGLDAFMQTQLSGDKLTQFKTERMAERAQRVEQEADRSVQRLDNIVGLDDQQRDQVFGIMARSSRDYDPAMQLEGIGGQIGTSPNGGRQEAMMSVLRPEQRQAYEAERQRRRHEAEEDLGAIGLSLPPNWDLLDNDDF
ncbi:hypothetical protein [Luteolibacter soli]|uniref:Uncharacterized protein n=1 Tax=Luteolibacter soli TaxID=3135280 RepID=A0ABU9AWK8_9BACT